MSLFFDHPPKKILITEPCVCNFPDFDWRDHLEPTDHTYRPAAVIHSKRTFRYFYSRIFSGGGSWPLPGYRYCSGELCSGFLTRKMEALLM